MQFIDLKAQQGRIRQEIDRRIQTVLDHGQYIMGPEVYELEEKLTSYVGIKHCIGVASGTDALLIAMMALGIGHGDEVVTTPFTFVATAETIRLIGAKPVFVDIDPRTCNIDPSLIEPAITSHTKAIIPVSLYGQCADMDRINEIAGRYGLPVIEDAAQSLGATYRGRQSCGISTIGCTSFFPSKPLGCYGDGGACFTNDDALAARMRQIRVHGQDRRYHHPLVGVNGRLDTLQAAILLAKLDRFPEEIRLRGELGAYYSELLSRNSAVTVPWIDQDSTSVYAQYTIQVGNRDAVQSLLNANGIPTAVHYPVPLHMQPAFTDAKYGSGTFHITERACQHVLSLPMHPYLTHADIHLVADAINKSAR